MASEGAGDEQSILHHTLGGLLAGQGNLFPRLREPSSAVGGEGARFPDGRNGRGGKRGTERDEGRRFGYSIHPSADAHDLQIPTSLQSQWIIIATIG